MRQPARKSNGQDGTTLVELLVTMVILGLILMGIFYVWSYNQQAYLQGSEAAELQQNARVAMEQLAREIRLSGYDPCRYVLQSVPVGTNPGQTPCSGGGAGQTKSAFDPNRVNVFPVQPGYSATDITIRMDRDGDGLIGNTVDPPEQVRFQYSGTTLSRTAGNGAAQELARDISAFSFQYFTSTGAAPTDWDQIALIRITLTAQQTFLGSPLTVNLQSDVRLRDR